MNILVTGGAGFIGSNIVDELIALGHNTTVIDNLSTGCREYVNKKANFYKIDINSSKVKDILKQENINYVIHHAAQIDVQKSLTDPVFDARNNIIGTINLLKSSVQAGVKKVVYASSAALYGQPDYLPLDEKHPVKAMSPYGISKHTPEHYLKMFKEIYDLDYTILRYSNVYGPRQDPTGEGGVVSIFVDRMLNGQAPIIYGDGEQTRDFIYVGDIVSANIAALSNGNGELVNISCNTRNSVNEIKKIINDILDSKLKPIYKDERDGDIKHSVMDNSKSKKILNWQPEYDLNKGLRKTIKYYLKNKEMEEVTVTLEDE